jgi:putative FmdB family regulatory protein
MPIYEYQCDSCGKRVEIFSQTASHNEAPTHCACGKERHFSRVMSSFAAHGAADSSATPDCCAQGYCGTSACGCGNCGSH